MLHQVEVCQQGENSCGKNCHNDCSEETGGWFDNEQLFQFETNFQIKKSVIYTFQDSIGQFDKGSQDTNNQAVAGRPVDLEDTFMLEVVPVIN